jgi:hypothetical protein
VLAGQTLTEFNALFLRHLSSRGQDPGRVAAQIESSGSIAGISALSPETKSLFRTALELPAEDHLRVQAAFQKHVDNAVVQDDQPAGVGGGAGRAGRLRTGVDARSQRDHDLSLWKQAKASSALGFERDRARLRAFRPLRSVRVRALAKKGSNMATYVMLTPSEPSISIMSLGTRPRRAPC